MQKYSIPCTVKSIEPDEPRPIDVFGGGHVEINGENVPIESVHDMLFDMLKMNDFPVARRAIGKLAGVNIALTDHVIAGSVRCYVTALGTVRLWVPEKLMIEYDGTSQKDKKMMKEARRRYL